MRWKLRMRDGLKVARFDEEALVFNPVSWQTHLLNHSTLQALEALTLEPKSLDELVAAIFGDAVGRDRSAEEFRMAEALVAELETLGLVVEVDSPVPCE